MKKKPSIICILLTVFIAFNAGATVKKSNPYIKVSKQEVEFTLKDVKLNEIAYSKSLNFDMRQGEINIDPRSIGNGEDKKKKKNKENKGGKESKDDDESHYSNSHNDSKKQDLPAPMEDIPLIGQFFLCLIVLIFSKKLKVRCRRGAVSPNCTDLVITRLYQARK
ncbi:hypothetical protein ACET69_22860 [Aeromonas veronii]